ncbi:hypothetical protein [Pedobacter sp. R-06]|uniref:hypothetical protein n=1 Tax=Pedobacter sp. R-06 TaxID=3404051 RepID=UPI003CFA3590
MGNKKSQVDIELDEKVVQMDKAIAVQEEIKASFQFVVIGMQNIKSLNSTVSNNHVVLQLLSSGFERLIKILILIKEKHKNGTFPRQQFGDRFFKDNGGGHGIDQMLTILLEYGNGIDAMMKNTVVVEDLEYLEKDRDFLELIRILTKFSISQRYFYIDTLIMEKRNTKMNPFEAFGDFLYSLLNESENGSLSEQEADAIVFTRAVSCIERGLRAISRFFIFGFEDLGKTYYDDFSAFILLKDEDLGKMKYVQKLIVPNEGYVPMKAPSLAYFKILALSRKAVLKPGADWDWPFMISEVAVFSVQGGYYLVKIGEELFALSTSCSEHFKIPPYNKSKNFIQGKAGFFLMEEAKKLNV